MTLHEALAKSVVVAGRMLVDERGRSRAVDAHHEPAPISSRRFDWRATFEDYDLGDPMGFGRTADEAVADLMDEIGFRQSTLERKEV